MIYTMYFFLGIKILLLVIVTNQLNKNQTLLKNKPRGN